LPALLRQISEISTKVDIRYIFNAFYRSEKMSDSIHGHEVLQLLLEYPQGLSKRELLLQMTQRFGADARFHTCSASGMDAEALLQFLAQKGKFIDRSQGFTTDASLICNH
jgi:probable metal-binding protein